MLRLVSMRGKSGEGTDHDKQAIQEREYEYYPFYGVASNNRIGIIP
jgi:hypothetical protein